MGCEKVIENYKMVFESEVLHWSLLVSRPDVPKFQSTSHSCWVGRTQKVETTICEKKRCQWFSNSEETAYRPDQTPGAEGQSWTAITEPGGKTR